MITHFATMQKAYKEIKCQMHSDGRYVKCVSEPHERLKEARLKAGFETAAEAAEALGVKSPTYFAHENGSRGLKRGAAEKYARRFKVTTDWLMFGRGNGPGSPDAQEMEVIEIWRHRKPEQRRQILQILRTFQADQ